MSSREEALYVCHEWKEPLHLLLTDVVMPAGRSGPQLADRVASISPDIDEWLEVCYDSTREWNKRIILLELNRSSSCLGKHAIQAPQQCM